MGASSGERDDERAGASQESRRRSWIGHFFRLFRGHYVLGSAGVGLLLYVGGLIAATGCGLGREYLDSRIWVLATGIAWVLAWGERSDRYLATLPSRVRNALRDPQNERFDHLVDRWHRRLYGVPRSLFLGLLVAAFIEYLTFYEPEFWEKRLPPQWATSGHEGCAQWILFPYFLVGSVLAVTMVLGFVDFISFARNILGRNLTLNLSVARASLRHITVFGLETGLGWSVAVALTAAFFAPDSSAAATGGLVVLALMGFALILVPQALAHEALTRTHDELVVAALRDFDVKDEAVWVRRFVKDADEANLRVRAFVSELDQFPVWIYSPAEAMSFLAEILGTLAAIFALLEAG